MAGGAVKGECFAAVEHGKVVHDIWLVEGWQAKCVAEYLINRVAVFVNHSLGHEVLANIGPHARTEWCIAVAFV